MSLEHLGRGHVEAVNSDFNSKLYECCYPGGPVEKSSDNGKQGNPEHAGVRDHTTMLVSDTKESPEQRADQKIKDRFGADVFEHLKDWDWLIENRKKLEDGFKKANAKDAWDMAWRMRELSMVDGKPLIYLSKEDGPTRGNLIPKAYDIYLRRGWPWNDDSIGRLHR